jgi:uncharacterized protein
MRFLFWLALIALVIFALRSKVKSAKSAKADVAQPNRDDAGGTGEPMLCCAHCGVYIPVSEAIKDDDADEAIFCSQEHRRLHNTASDHPHV